MELTQLEDAFVDVGGQFLTSAFDLREKMRDIKAVVLDWDGVFNHGKKDLNGSSGYSTIDTEGLDRFRYGYFRAMKGMLKTALLCETENPQCTAYARAAHIDGVYTAASDKRQAFLHFCEKHNLAPTEVIYIYDDINDLPVASMAGIRLAIGRLCSPLLLDYIEHHRLADYISSCQGNEHAVREISELLLALIDEHHAVMDHTGEYDADYADYCARKQAMETHEVER